MNLNLSVIQLFDKLTTSFVEKFINKYILFVENKYQSIIEYYSGLSLNLEDEIFIELNKLLIDNKVIIQTFYSNKNSLNNTKYWDLLEQLEDIEIELQTIKNTAKWLRSSVNKESYSRQGAFDVILNQGFTLEIFNKNVLNDNEFNNSWVETALNNNLIEEDYTLEGGNLLTTTFTRGANNLFIESVVDIIVGETIYGLDIQKKFEFEDDDLKVLNYKDTFKQTILILSSLKKNDNPNFPTQGIDKNLVIGTNINLFSYPIVFRQMSETFSNDDSIKSFSITDIKREGDSIYMQFVCESRISDIQNIQVNLSN